jgi:TrmH family RNA methyltransferase
MTKAAIHISSTSNPRFKFLQSLEKSKVRKAEGLCAVEGLKEIEMALEGGREISALFYTAEAEHSVLYKKLLSKFKEIELFVLSDDLYSKSAYRETSNGMIALVKTETLKLSELNLPEAPLLLIVSGVEKPGNIGAILRTADASALDAVICCDMPGDLFNPNTIRASLGTVFTVPVVLCETNELMSWLKQKGIRTFCTNLHKAVAYQKEDYTGPSAIVMGTEANGVSESWIQFADCNVKIPMLGHIDSMNVSVAAAIMIYEAKRQRGFR